MSSYSEDDIRRAAEIREWLVKQISDKQEEVERLRTTLTIVDSLLKQGSFKAAASLGSSLAATAATSTTTTTTTTAAAPTITAQVQQQQQQQQARRAPPVPSMPATATTTTAAGRQQQPSLKATDRRTAAAAAAAEGGEAATTTAVADIRPLKRAKDDFLLATAEVTPDSVVIVPAPGVNLNVNTPPFRSFFLNRILDGMKNKDAEKIAQGSLKESEALSYKVEDDGSTISSSASSGTSGGGQIRRIVINNYRERERLQEIFNTSTWVFTRMLEKSGGSSR